MCKVFWRILLLYIFIINFQFEITFLWILIYDWISLANDSWLFFYSAWSFLFILKRLVHEILKTRFDVEEKIMQPFLTYRLSFFLLWNLSIRYDEELTTRLRVCLCVWNRSSLVENIAFETWVQNRTSAINTLSSPWIGLLFAKIFGQYLHENWSVARSFIYSPNDDTNRVSTSNSSKTFKRVHFPQFTIESIRWKSNVMSLIRFEFD